jgi:hypothetical protein
MNVRSRNNARQGGVSDAALLLGLAFLFILAVVALPKYLKWRETAGVPQEILLLRQINAAEQKYRTKISLKNTYGSFKQLTENKVLAETCPDCDEHVRPIEGLRFEMVRNYEETRFCVSVATKDGKTLAIDADGAIHEFAGGRVGCAMGEAAGGALRVIK